MEGGYAISINVTYLVIFALILMAVAVIAIQAARASVSEGDVTERSALGRGERPPHREDAAVETISPIAAYRRWLRREATEEWYVPVPFAEACFVLPLAGAVLVGLSRLSLPLFRSVTDEDRLLEWLQVFGYLTAAVVAAIMAQMLWRRGRHLFALVYGLFALGAFFVSGEEIAWGQHIFGWATPAGLAAINHQKETTLHNIDQGPFNLVMLVVGLYGSVGSWYVRRAAKEGWRETVNLLTPPLFLTSAFFVLFGYKLLRFTVLPDPRYYVVNLGEWAEFCLASGLALFVVLGRRRLRALPPRRVTAARTSTLPPGLD